MNILADVKIILINSTQSKYDKYLKEGSVLAKKPLKKMSGSTLFCRNSLEDIYDFGIEFKFMNRVTITQVDTDIEKIRTINGTYEELSDKIIINYKNQYGEKDKATIYRMTGKSQGLMLLVRYILMKFFFT